VFSASTRVSVRARFRGRNERGVDERESVHQPDPLDSGERVTLLRAIGGRARERRACR
jgi:hypothetical protein